MCKPWRRTEKDKIKAVRHRFAGVSRRQADRFCRSCGRGLPFSEHDQVCGSDKKFAALAWLPGFDPHLSAVGFDDAADQCQPHARAVDSLVQPFEQVEYALLIFPFDSVAVITHEKYLTVFACGNTSLVDSSLPFERGLPARTRPEAAEPG